MKSGKGTFNQRQRYKYKSVHNSYINQNEEAID